MEPVKYQFTKREYVIDMALRFWCRKSILSTYIPLLMIFAIFAYLPLYRYYLIAIVIFAPLISLYLINKNVKDNPHLVAEKTLNINENGIKESSVKNIIKLSWSFYKKWSEDNKYIFLYHDDLPLSIIPKRAFTNEQLMEFKTLLSEKIRPS